MDIMSAVRKTRTLFASGQAVLWKSAPGMGKSQVSAELFKQLRDEGAKRGENWGFGMIFAATQTPPDLIGYQFKGERMFPTGEVDSDGKHVMRPITITDPSVPLWMLSTEGKPAFMYDKFFLLIEEYGQGEGDVKRATAEIFLNGGTAPWYLPPGSVRLALTNVDATDGVTKDFDFCIARRTEIPITPDIKPLLDHADKPYIHQGKQWQVMPVTKAWMKANPTIPFEAKPKQQGPWCNPRQLFAADRYLQLAFEENGKQECTSEDMEVLGGTIGTPAAASYAAHLQFLTQLPSYEEIVVDPNGTKCPERADLKMLLAYQLAALAKPEDMTPLVTFMQNNMPKDMSITFVASLIRRSYKDFINTPGLQAWLQKNAALVAVISSL